MPLLTPILKIQLANAFIKMIAGSGQPPTPEQVQKAQEIAGEIASAFETYIKAATVTVQCQILPSSVAPPGSLMTAGSPAAQASVTPIPLAPVPVSGFAQIS